MPIASRSLISKLLKKLTGIEEKVGFVLSRNKVIEVDNISNDPQHSFDVGGEDLLKYYMVAKATWHTHPNSDSNLSQQDYKAFQRYPNLEHYIIGKNGVRCFYVEKETGLVIEKS